MTNWMAITVLGVSALASASGTILLNYAAIVLSPALAILGATLWAASAAGFVWLAHGYDLGTLAILTSALGLITVNVIGVTLFAEDITVQKLVALSLLIAALTILSWPSGHG
ncbi:hypothetical protein [Thalassococcus sp. S3]|uniref:hypothetical protein n=1 Tax=Thalassococcus sp. S3 TaxID=2017482 RepID=UPI0010247323|nr:hypothetical protein [Thalassococcus sp. S3]QBF32342.1 hypothetical protein CFI11_14125 [Thalassococcus sp. S3]